MRMVTKLITEERLPGNQETLCLPMRNSKNALDTTNHTLVSMTTKKLSTGLHLLLRNKKLKKLKLKRRPRSPLKLKLLLKLRPKPKLKKKLKRLLKSQRNLSKMYSSTLLRKNFLNWKRLSK